MSSIIRVDHSTMARPFGVSCARPEDRSRRSSPMFASRFRSRVLAAGCVIPCASAA